MIWSAATVPTIELALLGAGVVMLAWAGFGLRGRGLVAPRPADLAPNAMGRDGRDLVLALVALAFAGALVVALLVLFDTGRNILATAGARSGPNLGAGALIAAILGAPFVIWATILKHRQFDLQKDGQITDRISKAVEQLGAEKTVKDNDAESTRPNIEVRIGALLSLERIAQDSVRNDAGRDHVRVMEILCAYIRHNAPASDERPSPRADVQLALEVLGRRSPEQRRHEARWGPQADPEGDWIFDHPPPCLPEPSNGPVAPQVLDDFRKTLDHWEARIDAYRGYRLDLRDTNLRGADLSGLNFSGARFENACLERAQCRGARLIGSVLSGVAGEKPDFFAAQMQGADMSFARMDSASFWKTELTGADFRSAELLSAYFQDAVLVEANFFAARLSGAIFNSARLTGAYLILTRVQGADFSNARMEHAYFQKPPMDRATSLFQARLDYAAFRRVNFTEVGLDSDAKLGIKDRPSIFCLTEDQINSAFGDGSVSLPEGLSPPPHWAAWALPRRGARSFETEWKKWRSDPSGYTSPWPAP